LGLNAEEVAKNPFLQVLAELEQFKDEPRFIVMVTAGMVELATNTLVDAHCKRAKAITESHRDFPQSVKLTILYELGVISEHHFHLLNWIRKRRNDAAHVPFFKLNPPDFENFANAEHRDVKNFKKVCALIIIDLWTSFFAELAPVFTPGISPPGEHPKWLLKPPFNEHIIPLKNDAPREPAEANAQDVTTFSIEQPTTDEQA